MGEAIQLTSLGDPSVSYTSKLFKQPPVDLRYKKVIYKYEIYCTHIKCFVILGHISNISQYQ